jgi:lipoprotein-releasing system permease protein
VYKLLLCWRYLRTRYLALVCIISVMLGVATLIVVNSVMSGFSTKLRDNLHGMLSDATVDAVDFNGMDDPEGKMARIRSHPFLGPRVVAMTPTLDIFAMLQYRVGPEQAPFAKPVRMIGIDPEGRKRVGGFAEHLLRPDNREHPSFRLTEEAALRYQWEQFADRRDQRPIDFDPPPNDRPGEPPPPRRPWERRDLPAAAAPPCIILGYAIAHYRDPSIKPGQPPRDVRILEPGDTVVVTTLGGNGLAPVYSRFVVADYSRTDMSDYDANYVFVPLDYLQKLRNMEDRVTSIQLRLRDYTEAPAVVEHLRELFPNLQVSTWEHKQGPLLAAISVERGILNVLLFMIIGVAGFGILAIFSMIVVEKTRDIGVLKALGASNWGVLKIFLGYGLLLGLVGAALGSVLGLSFTAYINEIEKVLTHLTGQEIFDRNVYYFDKIPTNVQPWTVMMVNLGAVGIAVLFSVLPALRAALLHPVRALRYE